MSTLAEPAVVDLCKRRILRLSSNAPAKWGRMTAPQMLCHLNDSFRVAMGEKFASRASSPIPRGVMKWLALRAPLEWPHGVPTRPEIEQGSGGTPPSEWERDRAELLELLEAFPERHTFGDHPMFGKMSRRDWLTWGYRHVDHHLRQFGV
ncbi:MAG TPA: DUF1569 domain-containing protein [Bryobacteraceae bacterium]|nr:DUF1569 domain-containing protein [Bryobacteraceae bacterium]